MKPTTRKDFVNRFYNFVKEQTQKTGIFPQTLLAQAIVESQGKVGNSWLVGGSGLASKYNNFFGIKATSSWPGKRVNLKTGEVYNGIRVTETAAFRVYDSIEDSIKDYINFLKINPRYEKAGVFTATTYAEQAQRLKAAGYATDPNYAVTIAKVADEVNKYIKEIETNTPTKPDIKPLNFILVILLFGAYLFIKK